MRPVTIVVPIYNAFEYLKLCLESVAQHTEIGENVDVVLVNDSSTDERIKPLLESYKEQGWKVLHNEKNLGFPGTANRGMGSDPSRDCVLLNSDVIVFANWLNRLQEAAYLESNVGTATALSNNASEFSWPGPVHEDQPVSPSTARKIAATLAVESSNKPYFDIPVGVGHCMYIKRDMIDSIGDLNEKEFGIGYGEEVDFCLRGSRAGYRHVMAANCYVYHAGSASMDSVVDAKSVCAKNNKKLRKLHPDFFEKRRSYFIDGYSAENHDRVSKRVLNSLCAARRRRLIVLHNSPRSAKIGGIEYHVGEIAAELRNEDAVFVLGARDETSWDLYLYLDDMSFAFRFENLNESKACDDLLKAVAPSTVHIHHTKNVPTALVTAIFEHDIPTVLTVHDYHLVCPNYCLLDERDKYCGLPAIESAKHERCLSAHGFQNIKLSEWRQQSQALLDRVSETVFVSSAARDVFSKALNVKTSKIIPCGIRKNELSVQEPGNDAGFSVCFLGVGARNKGQNFSEYIIEQLVEAQIEVHLLGSIASDWSATIRKNPLVKIHGRYQPADVVERIQSLGCSVVCLLSPWPETFSRTLSEAWAAGVPAVVSNLGALGERVSESGAGWVIQERSVREVVDLLRQLSKRPDLVQKARQKIRPALAPDSKAVSKELLSLYSTLHTNDPTPDLEAIWAFSDHPKVVSWSASIPDTPIGYLLYKLSLPQLISTENQKQPYNRQGALAPEYLASLFENSLYAVCLGKLVMVYLRIHSVGVYHTIKRPMMKLRGKLARFTGLRVQANRSF